MVVQARTHPAQLTTQNSNKRVCDGRGARGRSRTSRREGRSSPQAHLSGGALCLPAAAAAASKALWASRASSFNSGPSDGNNTFLDAVSGRAASNRSAGRRLFVF